MKKVEFKSDGSVTREDGLFPHKILNRKSGKTYTLMLDKIHPLSSMNGRNELIIDNNQPSGRLDISDGQVIDLH